MTKTYTQRRAGRLGWVHALVHRERELRDTRGRLDLEYLRADQQRVDALEADAIHSIETGELRATIAALETERDQTNDTLNRLLVVVEDAVGHVAEVADLLEQRARGER